MSLSLLFWLTEGSQIPRPSLSNGSIEGRKVLPSTHFHSTSAAVGEGWGGLLCAVCCVDFDMCLVG